MELQALCLNNLIDLYFIYYHIYTISCLLLSNGVRWMGLGRSLVSLAYITLVDW